MLINLPKYISIVFGLTTIVTFIILFTAISNSKDEGVRSKSNIIIVLLTIWLLVQMILSYKNFYNTNTLSFPPRFALLVLPPLLLIITLFLTKSGRNFIDNLPLVNLTYLNIVRIPVELVLYWLFLNKFVPELMTFSGRNFDILSGISAPFIAFFGLQHNFISRKIILIWNFLALGLLINIVVIAVLSAPFTFQKLAFEQPNIGVLYFPFTWLPAFIVPVVLFCHLVSIRQLIKYRE